MIPVLPAVAASLESAATIKLRGRGGGQPER